MRVFDKGVLHLISIFELVTSVPPLDCIDLPEKTYYVVDKKKMGSVLMNKGRKIKTLENHIRKNVVIFSYQESAEDFLKEAISDKIRIREADGAYKIFVSAQDSRKVKSDGEAIKSFLERLYNVQDAVFRR
jgi:transcription antitermination factor NusA-like protein